LCDTFNGSDYLGTDLLLLLLFVEQFCVCALVTVREWLEEEEKIIIM